VAVEVSWYDPVRKRAFEEDLGGYFNVSAPTVTATVTPTANNANNGMVISQGGQLITLGLAAPGQAGMTFSAAGAPSGWNYEWVQVVTTDTETNTGFGHQLRSTGGPGLDADYPYALGLSANDSPGATITVGHTFTVDFSAKMWLMCEPTGVSDATYVPLASAQWSYRFQAACDLSGRVTFVDAPSHSPEIALTLAPETQFPKWSQMSSEYPYWTQVY
jgi:hypothetical protein